MLDSYPGCSLGSSQSQHTSNKHAWHISEGGFHPFHEAAPTTPTMNDSLIGKHPKSRALQFRKNFQDISLAQQSLQKIRSQKTRRSSRCFFLVWFLVRLSTKKKKKRHRKTHEFPRQKTPSPPAVALQGYQANLVPKRRFASADRVQTTTPSAHHPRVFCTSWFDGTGGRIWKLISYARCKINGISPAKILKKGHILKKMLPLWGRKMEERPPKTNMTMEK